jgi:hypothetical protein
MATPPELPAPLDADAVSRIFDDTLRITAAAKGEDPARSESINDTLAAIDRQYGEDGLYAACLNLAGVAVAAIVEHLGGFDRILTFTYDPQVPDDRPLWQRPKSWAYRFIVACADEPPVVSYTLFREVRDAGPVDGLAAIHALISVAAWLDGDQPWLPHKET